MVHLITGYAGKPHVTSSSDGAVNMGMYGKGKYILDIGEKFGYEIISNNVIKIKSGYAINQGRKIEIAINDYEEVTIDNGLQGMKRCDLIVLRYEKSPDSGIETASLVAIKGISGDTYTVPECLKGDILAGEGIDDFLLYKVSISGLSIEKVESMFTVTKSGMEILKEYKDLLAGHTETLSRMGEEMTDLGKSVADGKALVAKAISDKGVSTATDAVFAVLADNIRQMAANQYSAGVTAADGRAAPGTVNYQSGYNSGWNQGVAAADNRANSNSANWQNGYATGVAQADGRAAPGTVNYQSGYNAGVNATYEDARGNLGSHDYSMLGCCITSAYKESIYPQTYPYGNISAAGQFCSVGPTISKKLGEKYYDFILVAWYCPSVSWNGWHVMDSWAI